MGHPCGHPFGCLKSPRTSLVNQRHDAGFPHGLDAIDHRSKVVQHKHLYASARRCWGGTRSQCILLMGSITPGALMSQWFDWWRHFAPAECVPGWMKCAKYAASQEPVLRAQIATVSPLFARPQYAPARSTCKGAPQQRCPGARVRHCHRSLCRSASQKLRKASRTCIFVAVQVARAGNRGSISRSGVQQLSK